MFESFPRVIEELVKASRDMWLKGWTEANGGNISVRLPDGISDIPDTQKNSPWIELPESFTSIAGERFLVTGTGKYLRNIELNPAENIGIIQLDNDGSHYRLLWGYTAGGRPTSELSAHLQTHAIRKKVSNDTDRVFIHTHCPNLIALTFTEKLDTAKLTALLWSMHIECIVMFPEGIEFIPWLRSGSVELGQATGAGLSRRRAILWQHHGIGAVGKDLDSAFGVIHTAEKAAEIYLKVKSAGGIVTKLSVEQLLALPHAMAIEPDTEIIDSMRIANVAR